MKYKFGSNMIVVIKKKEKQKQKKKKPQTWFDLGCANNSPFWTPWPEGIIIYRFHQTKQQSSK